LWGHICAFEQKDIADCLNTAILQSLQVMYPTWQELKQSLHYCFHVLNINRYRNLRKGSGNVCSYKTFWFYWNQIFPKWGTSPKIPQMPTPQCWANSSEIVISVYNCWQAIGRYNKHFTWFWLEFVSKQLKLVHMN